MSIVGLAKNQKTKENIGKLLDIFSGILTVAQLSPVGNQYFSMGSALTKKVGGILKDTPKKTQEEIKKQLDQMLKEAKQELAALGCSHRWDSQTVGALLVKLSATRNEMLIDIPTFQPCLDIQEDIDYLWRVYLGPELVSMISSVFGSPGIGIKVGSSS